MEPVRLVAAFFAFSRSRNRPNLVRTGVGSGTSDFGEPEPPKKWRLRNIAFFLIYFLLICTYLFIVQMSTVFSVIPLTICPFFTLVILNILIYRGVKVMGHTTTAHSNFTTIQEE